jgi:AdoMet-dependent rRNA methyltransferase SPB1
VEVAPITREEMEEQLDKELEDKMSEIDRKKKREKKKERERKAKLRQRAALGMETPGDGGVQEQEVDLFSAASVLRKDAADLLLDQAPDDVLESPEDSEEGLEFLSYFIYLFCILNAIYY